MIYETKTQNEPAHEVSVKELGRKESRGQNDAAVTGEITDKVKSKFSEHAVPSNTEYTGGAVGLVKNSNVIQSPRSTQDILLERGRFYLMSNLHWILPCSIILVIASLLIAVASL